MCEGTRTGSSLPAERITKLTPHGNPCLEEATEWLVKEHSYALRIGFTMALYVYDPLESLLLACFQAYTTPVSCHATQFMRCALWAAPYTHKECFTWCGRPTLSLFAVQRGR